MVSLRLDRLVNTQAGMIAQAIAKGMILMAFDPLEHAIYAYQGFICQHNLLDRYFFSLRPIHGI